MTIEVRSLTKRYGSTTAVEDLSFTVTPGAVTAFLGPNGAGKTTTLRILLGLVRATSGAATIDGTRYPELDAPGLTVGAVLEQGRFHPGRRARDHLHVVATALGVAEPRVDEVLDQVGLQAAARRRVGGFSLGMRQRLDLATALLGDPPVLVLDEPANGLDPEGVRWLRDLLRARAAAGATVLLSSHVLTDVQLLADRVVVIANGRLRGEGTLDQLAGGRSEVLVRSPAADRLAEALAAQGVHARRDGDALFVTGATAAVVGETAHAHRIAVHELTPQQQSLEDVFLELTSESQIA